MNHHPPNKESTLLEEGQTEEEPKTDKVEVVIKDGDIRNYMTKKNTQKSREDKNVPEGRKEECLEKNGNDRMHMMRGKMTSCRKRKEFHERRKRKLLNRKRMSKSYNGEKLIDARDVTREEIQDDSDLVVIGAGVEGLYPSLPDI